MEEANSVTDVSVQDTSSTTVSEVIITLNPRFTSGCDTFMRVTAAAFICLTNMKNYKSLMLMSHPHWWTCDVRGGVEPVDDM